MDIQLFNSYMSIWGMVQVGTGQSGWSGAQPVVGVSASPLHHKVQKFSSGTGSPGWSRKKGRKTVVVSENIKSKCFSLSPARQRCVVMLSTLVKIAVILQYRDITLGKACTWGNKPVFNLSTSWRGIPP